MAITISNLRIMPWSQKDTLKAVFGDVMTLTFTVPHVDGESYLCGLDNERVVYPPSRPICAYTDRFVRDGDNITLQLNLTTSKLRDYVSTIRKPMPVWLQLVRVVGDKYETILLDDILALPSVIDGAMTVYEGDPLDAKLKAKMDKPLIDGTIGQVLTMGADGHYAWADLPEIPEQEQANWDESDSTAYSYIRNKPDLSIYVEKVEGKGLSTNDFTNDDKAKLTGIEAGAEVNVQADWGESDSTNDAYIKNKPDLSIYVEKEAGKGLSTNDYTNEDKAKLGGIEDGAEVNVQADWDVSDSALDSYIKHKPALATVATTGDYNDLLNKPVQKNADWDESDSADPAYIENKPHIPADQVQADWDESDSSEVSYIRNKPDTTDYLCFEATNTTTMSLNKSNASLADVDLEYSVDKLHWTTYTWSNEYGTLIRLAKGDKVWWRGNNNRFSSSSSNCYKFSIISDIKVSGNIMSLLDKTAKSVTIPTERCFTYLFYDSRVQDVNELNLAATSLTRSCYAYMFSKADIKSIPILNNATGWYSHEHMFDNCKRLTDVSNFAPSGYFQNYCYQYMFANCTSLKRASDLSNASRYSDYCCSNMFAGCTSLIDAPIVPSNLGYFWISQLFSGCSALSHVRVSFTQWHDNATYNWLNNVSATGIFECPSALDVSTRDVSHIPAGWTIVRTDDPHADWDESDSTEAAYIKNKPVIPQPEPQVQSDWEESDSSDVSYILNKPDLSGINTEIQEYTDAIKSKGAREPVCFTALTAGAQLKIYEHANPGVELKSTTFEYSTDKVNWSNLVVNDTFPNTEPFFTFTNVGDKVYLRHVGPIGNLPSIGVFPICSLPSNSQTPNVNVSGDLMSLIDGNSFLTSDTIPALGFMNVFNYVWSQPLLDFDGAYIDVDTIGDYGLQNFIGYCRGMHYPAIKANHLGTGAMTRALINAYNLTTYDFMITNDLEQCSYVLSSCQQLNDLTVHFTEWPEGGITDWLNGVSATGTFRCPAALDTTNRGASYIPEGWTIETF